VKKEDTFQWKVSRMKRNRFGKDLATGSYDLVVLDVLRERPAYAYEIIREISAPSRHLIRWREGTVYRVLHHLEKQGLVRGNWRGPKRGRQRKYYQLTERGRRAAREYRKQWREFEKSLNALLGP
jgi:PadR family transcriptional regulator PadR